jgi:hypothetical protein
MPADEIPQEAKKLREASGSEGLNRQVIDA